LDAFVAGIRNVDVPAHVHGDAVGGVELPVPATHATPGGDEGPVVRELLDSVIAEVGHEDVPAPVHAHANPLLELPVAAARTAPLGDKRSTVGNGRRRGAGGGRCRGRGRRRAGVRRAGARALIYSTVSSALCGAFDDTGEGSHR